jgi:hypothetical protein
MRLQLDLLEPCALFFKAQKTKKTEQENKKKAGWFGRWWGGVASVPNSSVSDVGNLLVIWKYN